MELFSIKIRCTFQLVSTRNTLLILEIRSFFFIIRHIISYSEYVFPLIVTFVMPLVSLPAIAAPFFTD